MGPRVPGSKGVQKGFQRVPAWPVARETEHPVVPEGSGWDPVNLC